MPKYEATYDLSGYGDITIRNENNVVTIEIPEGEDDLQFWHDDDDNEWGEFVKIATAVADGNPVYQVEPVKTDNGPFISLPAGSTEDTVATIRSFITAKVPLTIEYTKLENDQLVTRTVSPWEIDEVDEYDGFTPPKYLRAWDHVRQGIRSYRITRISALRPASGEYVQPDEDRLVGHA